MIDIDCSLESLQKEVEGPIQAVYPWDDEVALICNEEGKLHDDCMEKLNRTLDGPYGIPIDIIVGTFLIVGLAEMISVSFCRNSSRSTRRYSISREVRHLHG